jgi:uncharacterized protein YfaS (alpha-2-macroglobulin family)
MPAARRDDFDLKRDWFTAEGQPLGNRPLRVGETAIVRLQVKTAGRYANGLVVDYIPAGVEIENANLVQGEQSVVTIDGVDPRQAMQNSNIRHVEFRDDRFVVAARLAGKMQFFYRVRVVTPGRFVVPPSYAEDMYQPQIYGLAGGDADAADRRRQRRTKTPPAPRNDALAGAGAGRGPAACCCRRPALAAAPAGAVGATGAAGRRA